MQVIAKTKTGCIIDATDQEIAMLMGNSPGSNPPAEGDTIAIGAIYNQLIALENAKTDVAAAKATCIKLATDLDSVAVILEDVTTPA